MNYSIRAHSKFCVIIISSVLLAGFAAMGDADEYHYGTWEMQKDDLTYINPVHNIVITFPDTTWQVYTEPKGDIKNIWDRPLWHDSSFTTLIAEQPDKKVVARLIIEPHAVGALFEDYFEAARHDMDSAYHEDIDITWRKSRLVEHDDRKIGVMSYTYGDREATLTMFNERDRFVMLVFSGPDGVFEKNKDEFWSLVDSYEKLGGVPEVDEYKD